MLFITLLTSAAVFSEVAGSLQIKLDLGELLGIDLSIDNYYGAPLPPWNHGAHPGWYSGSHPHSFPSLTCLNGLICQIPELFPNCLQCSQTPPPPETKKKIHAHTVDEIAAADRVTHSFAYYSRTESHVVRCLSSSSYHDVNGKDGSTKLTCSLFTRCHDSSDAINTGGQTQTDGSVNFITNSNGCCKNTQ